MWSRVSKRLFDIIVATTGLVISSPILIPSIIATWLQDFRSPFYIPFRVGKNGRGYKMIKLRSMVVDADRSGVDSTSANDPRITPLGNFVRSYKIDELPELWNVLTGDMSLVGPRPNVQRETDLYTPEEKGLLAVRPGITDLSSIVFSDENDILKDSQDPDIDYNQLIRPWKSRLGLLYVTHQSMFLDMRIVVLTAIALLSRRLAIAGVQSTLKRLGADEKLRDVARREQDLYPYPPPGSDKIVTER